MKYSQANHIKVNVSKSLNSIKFKIEDDGIGFVESVVERGNGLNSMQKRANELGTTLNISSEAKAGTQISFDIKT